MGLETRVREPEKYSYQISEASQKANSAKTIPGLIADYATKRDKNKVIAFNKTIENDAVKEFTKEDLEEMKERFFKEELKVATSKVNTTSYEEKRLRKEGKITDMPTKAKEEDREVI